MTKRQKGIGLAAVSGLGSVALSISGIQAPIVAAGLGFAAILILVGVALPTLGRAVLQRLGRETRPLRVTPALNYLVPGKDGHIVLLSLEVERLDEVPLPPIAWSAWIRPAEAGSFERPVELATFDSARRTFDLSGGGARGKVRVRRENLIWERTARGVDRHSEWGYFVGFVRGSHAKRPFRILRLVTALRGAGSYDHEIPLGESNAGGWKRSPTLDPLVIESPDEDWE